MTEALVLHCLQVLKHHNNISVAELCQGEDAGDHVPLIPGGDIPELQ